MSKVLGLDIGSNSIGWALINDSENKIIDMGVRIFEEGVNNINQEKEASNNVERREARQRRKLLWRRKMRKFRLKRKLIEIGLMPKTIDDKFWQIEPYEARSKASKEKVEKFEIGRALYHLCQRRGYLSNRKAQKDDKEDSTIYEGDKKLNKPGISELRKAINDGGHKTLGQYLSTLNPHEVRIRNRYTERKMYKEEINMIWDIQKKFYPDILTDENFLIIKKYILYQRPLKSQKHTIGHCIFEKNKRRAPKSSLIAQEFRMLQQINSLSISGGSRIEESQKMLSFEEREKLIEYLSNHGELKLDGEFKTLKNILSLGKEKYSVNLEHQGKIDGLKTIYSLKKNLDKDFDKFSNEDIHKMWHTLYFAEQPEWLKYYAIKTWKLSEEVAEKFSKIKLESGYMSLSAKAMKKMLPYMREGKMYHQAADLAGYKHSLWDEEIELLDLLPEPPNVANPIVNRGMNQLRKVVNDTIEHYSKPDMIRVEMARELKIPRRRRLDMLRDNRENQKRNEDYKQRLIDDGIVEKPSRNDILKYHLWVECNETCPYTGKPISLNQLFITNEVDVEHILPYRRTLDDSYMNKTLCFVDENRSIKKDQTPYEAYSSDPAKFSGIKDRIKHFPHAKARRFYQQEVNELDEFISRQLNDTRYISREAVKYLKHITPDVRVSKGLATSILRYYWGLEDNILPKYSDKEMTIVEESTGKNREDHRHHAVDAITIALTTQSFLQKLSTLHHRYGSVDERSLHKFPIPWENLRNDVLSHLSNLIVSFKINKRVRGPLHQESLYGLRKNYDGTELINEKGYRIYTIRKPLESLTHSEIKEIVDPKIKEVVLERLTKLGIDVEKKFFNIPRNAFVEPLYFNSDNKVKRIIRKVRIRIPSITLIKIRNYNIWVEPGSNHHIVLFVDENGKKDGKVVSLYEASQRKLRKEPVVDKNIGSNCEFITSFQINECVIIGSLPDDFDVNKKLTYHTIFNNCFRVQKLSASTNQIFFRRHNASILVKINTYGEKVDLGGISYTPTTFNGKKIIVNPAGFIEFAND
jgi:CRISPR-associated endonuclease Csn1